MRDTDTCLLGDFLERLHKRPCKRIRPVSEASGQLPMARTRILTAEEYAKAKADLDRCGRRSEAKEVAPLRLLELLAQPPTGRERLLSLVFFSVQPESSDGNVLGAT